MGKMPNKLAGRSAALVLATLLAGAGYALGRLGGDRLAYGFTFDWYVHEVSTGYDVGHVLFWTAVVASLAAALSATLTALSTDAATRAWARRVRYAPPRYRDPMSLDLHTARLALGFAAGAGVLSTLGFYAVLAAPMAQGGAPIDTISQQGFTLLMGTAGAFGALLGTYFGVALTFEGVVAGTLVRQHEPNLIARASLFAVRNSKAVVALVLVATLTSGYFATHVTTNVDVADVMPRGDPNTAAAKNLTSTFKSSFTQQVTLQFRVLDVNNTTQMRLFDEENAEKLPNRVDQQGDPRPNNITDELYIRAMDEAVQFFLAEGPFKGTIGGADLYKLVNWTVAGGQNATDPDAFALPDTSREGELRYASDRQGVEEVGAIYNALDAVSSPTWRQMAVLLVVDPKSTLTTREIGEAALDVRERYVEAVRDDPGMYQVFGPDNPPQFSVDLPIANAHASELTRDDFRFLLPIIGVFIAITLFVAFRNVTSVVVTFSMLSIAVIWTFGVMGYLEIPLNTLNLAVVPLIMGIGIDYGIHMMNEYQEFRAKGMSMEDAWMKAGGGSAFALFVGMLTTVAGLLVMVISPSLLVAQVGLLGTVALLSCYTLAIFFIPAAVTLAPGGMRTRQTGYTPSRIMPALASAVSRSRYLVILVLLLLVGSAYASQAHLTREAFGDPPRNWLESDPLRREHERAIQGFYDTPSDDVKANVIIIEGDLTDPAVHDYINALTATLRNFNETGTYSYTDAQGNLVQGQSRIIADTLKDLPFLMNTWLTVKDGVPGAGAFLGKEGLREQFEGSPLDGPAAGPTANYPDTQEEVRQTLEAMFASPLRQFGYLFADAPEYKMTVILFSVRAATYEDAEQVWNEVQAAIAQNEALRPEGVQTHFFGNTAINYLFVAKQVPWLNAMNLVSIGIIIAIVAASTRKLRPVVTVAAVSGLASFLWFGLLPQVDIGLAISLTLPLIFISAMGSDYGLHLAMRCQRSGDTRHTFESVGKGVLFSFITTLGAFLIFTRISDLAGRRSIVATCLAISVVFAVTLLIVPLVFPVKKGAKEPPRPLEAQRHVPVFERSAPAPEQPAAATRVKPET